MNGTPRKLLTVVTEAALEGRLVKDIEALGARGYTITDVRGKGSRGRRDAAWDENRNIRIEVLCEAAVAGAIAQHLEATYYAHYGMVLYVTDVLVRRAEKF
jgi:hypothetical protein